MANRTFINACEKLVVNEAMLQGVKIKIESDDRGRYPTLTIREVGRIQDENAIESRTVNGKKIK